MSLRLFKLIWLILSTLFSYDSKLRISFGFSSYKLLFGAVLGLILEI